MSAGEERPTGGGTADAIAREQHRLVAIITRAGGASIVVETRDVRSEGGQYAGLRGGESSAPETTFDELRRQLPAISFGGLGQGFDVEAEWGEASSDEDREYRIEKGDVANPPQWDSTLCMQHWGLDSYQTSLDPNGYVIYVNGREQLGGNKYLVSDGVFIAKSLGRTLVEYPVLDSRVSGGDSKLGLGAYWDLSQLCMYHRIIDLHAFRDLVARGEMTSADFLTVGNSNGREHPASHMHVEEDVREFFKEYSAYKVIVMENTWKSSIDRESLSYLRPNPFYMGIVRMLLDSQKEWKNGNYLALQWRTETATGNLTECYSAVKTLVETHRKALGLTRHQVFVNTDLMGDTSGTYKQWQQEERHGIIDLIQKDYPESFDNNLHRFISQIEDSGVKAFVSGLAVASSRVMIASSLNMPETKALPEANVCQKPFSGYITLISEWRVEILKKSAKSTVRMFPFEM